MIRQVTFASSCVITQCMRDPLFINAAIAVIAIKAKLLEGKDHEMTRLPLGKGKNQRFRRITHIPLPNIARKTDVGSGTLATRKPTKVTLSDGPRWPRYEEAR